MTYTDDLLSKVTSFGILGYSIDKIIDLIDPPFPDQFRTDFQLQGSPVYKAYRKGKTSGEYNLDKSLFDKATKQDDTVSNTLLDQRIEHKKINDKILENFGL